jgi:endoglucanase
MFRHLMAAALLLPYNQVTNGTFDTTTAPWVAYGGASGTLRVADGQACVDTGTGTINPWDSELALPYLRIQNGVSYTLTFSARTSAPIPVTVLFQQNSPGYSTVLASTKTIPAARTTYTLTGTGKGDFTDGQLAFQFGGQAPVTFCVDDVSLLGGDPLPPYVPDTGPRMRVNQVGYLPRGPKTATLVTTATTPLPWTLTDAAGRVVRTGRTTPRGVDASSGQNVQTLDFSGVTLAGDGYRLTSDGATSYPFPIRDDIYKPLQKDSKTLFYTQRSGTPILDSVAPGYGRAAGHIGVAPNQGDTAVPCLAPVAFDDSWTCPAGYARDVTGGWYDAADHGKYVVNGGIAVSQLLSEYEHGNNEPSLLAETKCELDFLLKMQVPAGQPLAGMAYHKITDTSWTGLPLAPAADAKPRALHRPSTAATLNLAALRLRGLASSGAAIPRTPGSCSMRPRSLIKRPKNIRPSMRRPRTPRAAGPMPTPTSATSSPGPRPSCPSPPGVLRGLGHRPSTRTASIGARPRPSASSTSPPSATTRRPRDG